MPKKQINFRLDSEIIEYLDKLVIRYSNDTGIKLDRTKTVEKLIREGFRNTTK